MSGSRRGGVTRRGDIGPQVERMEDFESLFPPKKNQRNLLNQILLYLEVRHEALYSKKNLADEDDPIFQFLEKSLEGGACYGLSVFRAAMRVSKKLDWWQAMINHIIAWDGKIEALTEKHQYLLPGAINNEAIDLQTIFERFTHYLLLNHASTNFPYLKLTQRDFLKPGGQFEMLQDSKILKIKTNHSMGGYFTREQLQKIFDNPITQLSIEENICLIHADDKISHACELSFVNGKWNFFDPNYRNGQAKEFENTRKLVKEIKRVLGMNLRIQVASLHGLDVSPFPDYHELIKTSPHELIREKGLIVMARMDTNLVVEVLDSLKNEKINPSILNQVDENGVTPLYYAVIDNNQQAIDMLISKGANLNYILPNNQTYFIVALKRGKIDAIISLWRHINQKENMDINSFDTRGCTMLMLAAQFGITAAVQELIRNGAEINKTGNDFTPLMLAVIGDNADTIKALLDGGASLTHTISTDSSILQRELKNFEGQIPNEFTALHLAVFYGKENSVRAILDYMKDNDIKIKPSTFKNLKNIANTRNYNATYDLLVTRESEQETAAKKSKSTNANAGLFKRTKSSDEKTDTFTTKKLHKK